MFSKYQPFFNIVFIIHFIRNIGKTGKIRLNLSGCIIVLYSHSSPNFLNIIGDSLVIPENTAMSDSVTSAFVILILANPVESFKSSAGWRCKFSGEESCQIFINKIPYDEKTDGAENRAESGLFLIYK